MKIKLLIIVLVLAFLMGACGDGPHTYEMELINGETITVVYDSCRAVDEHVRCWEHYETGANPDAVYSVVSMKVID